MTPLLSEVGSSKRDEQALAVTHAQVTVTKDRLRALRQRSCAGLERTESRRESNRATSGRRSVTVWHMRIGAAPCVVSRNPEMKTPNR